MTDSTQNKKPLALIILDGWGYRKELKNNGIELAEKPYFDSLIKSYPHTLIDGSGPAVGLPKGIMGNSEVGHMNIGAGRIVFTGLSQIYQAIEDKSFFSNPALLKAIKQVSDSHSTLHLMGLLSDGAVHSHQDHLYALLELAKNNNIKNVAIHCFMDGRDTPPNDGIKYIHDLQSKIKEIGAGKITSISGRYFAMDRDKRWDRIEKAFLAITGQSKTTTSSAEDYLKESYAKGIGDEFIEPISITDNNQTTTISQKDAIIFFNFRADRARQISHVFTDKTFTEFERNEQNIPSVYVCMAPYEKSINAPVAFTPNYPNRILGEILAKNGLHQLRISETEKYAHVTFFFNGGKDQVFKNEDRCLIPSPKEVATYDLKPEMSAYEVKDELIKKLHEDKYDVIICNFANTDMVGHTAKPEAIKKAVHTVDNCLKEIIPEILNKDGTALITADHGNAELMIDENGEPMTAHTTNLVPLILASDVFKNNKLKDNGRLCDLAPTMLRILNIKQPKEMTGLNLIDD